MTSLKEVYGEDLEFLTADKIPLGKERSFIIDSAEIVEFQGKNRVRIKVCEKLKGGTGKCYLWTLNKTNAKKLMDAGLTDLEDLINKEIVVTSVLVNFKGGETAGLRITKVKY